MNLPFFPQALRRYQHAVMGSVLEVADRSFHSSTWNR